MSEPGTPYAGSRAEPSAGPGRVARALTSWRLALRLAARDALRHRGRSLLVLVMIALPVAAVGVADTVYSTSATTGTEALERRLGTGAARVDLFGSGNQVFQLADPEDGLAFDGGGRAEEALDVDDVAALLGGRPVTEVREGTLRYETALGVGDAEVVELDVSDPLTAGLVELTDGRWPADPGEVVVNADLADRGPGQALVLADGTRLDIVGTAESTRYTGYPRAFGPPGAFDLGRRAQRSVLVGGGPVTWEQVRALNERGAAVTSRAVLADPPPTDQLPEEVQWGTGGLDGATLTTLVLVVVMVLLEVVLLAGPAFAVGARRQARTLALVAAAGGTPAQARRVVLASGVVLGLAAALLGTLLGIGGAAVLMPLFQLASDTRFGPFDVEPLHLLGVAGFGLVSALLAAGVPAWLASRQDVVAVLAGRRGDARPSRRSPLLGLVLVGGGMAASAYGASRGTTGGGEIPIAVGAVASVLGMILLVPVVVATLARLARRLPLPLRFAARDAARHRTRTVPAVAAVAATVAGVVALGIAVSSDEAQNRETYRASLPMGAATVTDYRGDADHDAYAAAVRGVAPDLEVERVLGLSERRVSVQLRAEGRGRLLTSYGGPFASTVLVAEEVPDALVGLDAEERRAGDAVLAEGGALVLTDDEVVGSSTRVVVAGFGRDPRREAVTVPAVFVPVEGDYATVQAVVAPEVAERLPVRVDDVGLYLPGPVPAATAADVAEAVGAVRDSGSFYVERGYEAPDETVVVQLVLGALGAVLMLGGTLTATFLALSDARPDLATLSAVGAAPRTRRGVAASYALVVGLVGAVLGAVVGAVPGVAITYPLTGPVDLGMGVPDGPSHYLDVPWLLVVGVVVGLPLLTAAVVGLTARSRLPLTSRLD